MQGVHERIPGRVSHVPRVGDVEINWPWCVHGRPEQAVAVKRVHCRVPGCVGDVPDRSEEGRRRLVG